jgi:hypothetical protein
LAQGRFGQQAAAACRLVLVSIVVLCAGVALYAAMHRETFLSGPRGLGFFLGLPLLLGIGALAATRVAVETQLKIILVLFSTAFSLLVAELALLGVDLIRKAGVDHARALVVAELKSRNPDYDDRTYRQFFIDQWKAGDPVFPRIYQLSSRTVPVDGAPVFPTSSVSERKVVECFIDGRFKIFTSDEFGFVNPRGIHGARAEVIVVGDSFTAGDCVSIDEDIAAVLRRTHPATVNLGIGGAGPFWELANLVEYGLPLQPRYVFWLYYEGNDFADMQAESRWPELTQYLDGKTQNLRTRKAQVDAAVESLQRTEIESLTVAASTLEEGPSLSSQIARSFKLPRIRMRLGLHGDTTTFVAEQIETLERVILRAKGLVEGQGGTFVFVYVPDFSRFVGAADDFHRARVLEMLAANDVHLLDLLPRLEAHPDVLSLFPHRQTGHFAADGYAFIAEQLAAEIPQD